MGLKKQIVLKSPRAGSSSSFPLQRHRATITNKNLLEKYEEFKLWPERAIDYSKIHENITFRAQLQAAGLEEYTGH